MKKKKYNVVVAGATGAVGNEMVATLEQRDFPVDQLKLLASTRGAGTKIEFKYRGRTIVVIFADTGERYLTSNVFPR